jgi:tetratricopeptide (TPR) repeat protein
MQDFQTLETLIAEREIKKAEIFLARLMRSVQESSSQSKLLVYRARLRLMAARPGEALDDLRTAGITENAALPPDLLELLGDCHLSRFEIAPAGFADRNDVQQADAIYSRTAAEYPDYANLGWIYYQHGRVSLILDRVDTAQKYFREALFSPSEVTALTAYCYERLGYIGFYETRQPRFALTLLDKAVDTCPATESRLWLVQVHLLRSRVLSDMDPNGAIEAARIALKIASAESAIPARAAQSEALFTLAELLFKRGYRQEAVLALQQFLQISKSPQGIDVTWSRAYEMLGDACFEMERYDHALNAYKNVLVFNPYHPWEEAVQYRVARCYYFLRDYTKAAGTVTTILSKSQAEDNPVKDYRLYHLLGDAWFALGRFQESHQAYRVALDTAPSDVDVSQIRSYYEQSQLRRSSLPVQP